MDLDLFKPKKEHVKKGRFITGAIKNIRNCLWN